MELSRHAASLKPFGHVHVVLGRCLALVTHERLQEPGIQGVKIRVGEAKPEKAKRPLEFAPGRYFQGGKRRPLATAYCRTTRKRARRSLLCLASARYALLDEKPPQRFTCAMHTHLHGTW